MSLVVASGSPCTKSVLLGGAATWGPAATLGPDCACARASAAPSGTPPVTRWPTQARPVQELSPALALLPGNLLTGAACAFLAAGWSADAHARSLQQAPWGQHLAHGALLRSSCSTSPWLINLR